MLKIAIIMGSESDKQIMIKAEEFLQEMGIEFETFVASAHRTPEKVQAICKKIEKQFSLVIAGAGMAAHLPGVVAAYVTKPVIGVPINASFQGLDSLLAIVQMPTGIPVATVAVNGAKNAAILALEILALKDNKLRKKLKEFRQTFKT